MRVNAKMQAYSNVAFKQQDDLQRNLLANVESFSDRDRLERHQKRIRNFLKHGQPRHFKIIDTCRVDNGGIIANWRKLPISSQKVSAVAFVPAAGAGSRYLAPFSKLRVAVKDRDLLALKSAVTELVSEGFATLPLPEKIHGLMVNGTPLRIASDSFWTELDHELSMPKALFPVAKNGTTFLDSKSLEHAKISGLIGEIFIAPPEFENEFLLSSPSTSHVPRRIYAQHRGLSTVRFDAQSNPISENDGSLSWVPAGHGALADLLPEVRLDFPTADSVFIRNVDNVSGQTEPVVDELSDFLKFEASLLSELRSLRRLIRSSPERVIDNSEFALIRSMVNDKHSDLTITRFASLVLEKLFFTKAENYQGIPALLDRPLCVMGQVPNTTHDVGGTPVIAEVDGQVQRLCLELPHATPEDKRAFLENHSKATHFNPVLVALEIPSRETIESWEEHPFWLVAKKNYLGQDVYYHESILYELLGSSQHCNVIFLEVSRALFNPHKVIVDTSSAKKMPTVSKP